MAEPRRAAQVVCLGLATLDAIVAVDRLPRSDERLPAVDGTLAGGGVAATAAVALARLGVPVAFAGRIGDDAVGRLIRSGLVDEGVDVSLVQPAGGRSAFSVVLVERPTGARSLVPVASDAAAVEINAELVGACRAAEWIHVDHIGHAALAPLRAAGVTTRASLDAGNPIDGLKLDGLALYAPTEAALVTRYPGRGLDEALRAAVADGPGIVVVTRGGEGSVSAERQPDGSVQIERCRAGRGPVMSTLGAGDVFHGALLAALVAGRGVGEAMREANAAAALSCASLDGRTAIPSRAQLDAFLATDRDAVAGR